MTDLAQCDGFPLTSLHVKQVYNHGRGKRAAVELVYGDGTTGRMIGEPIRGTTALREADFDASEPIDRLDGLTADETELRKWIAAHDGQFNLVEFLRAKLS